jgi:hypothetical protein
MFVGFHTSPLQWFLGDPSPSTSVGTISGPCARSCSQPVDLPLVSGNLSVSTDKRGTLVRKIKISSNLVKYLDKHCFCY